MPPLVCPSGQLPAFDDDEKADLLIDVIVRAVHHQCSNLNLRINQAIQQGSRAQSFPANLGRVIPVTINEVKEEIASLQ